MSRPNFNRGQSNVTDWLDGHYEYVPPDDPDKGTKSYAYTRQDPVQATTPTPSEEDSSRGKGHKHRDHRSTRRHDRPLTPPSEDEMDDTTARERDRDRDREHHRRRKSRSASASGTRTTHDDTDHRAALPREHKETRYPPRADRGRPPARPPMKTASTTPDFREDRADKRQHHRRYSNSSSPPRAREDKASRHAHHHHHHRRRHRGDEEDDDEARSARHRDHRDRDRDSRTHYSGSSKASTHSSSTKARGGRKEETASPTAPPKSRRSSFSFLSDPRFATAAQAALTAGVSAAVGAVGKPNAGVKVAQAALGAAALGALKSPGTAPEEKGKGRSGDLGRRDSRRKR